MAKIERPYYKGSCVTTPSKALTIELLGALTFGSIALTQDELNSIQNLYNFVPEKPNKKPESPEEPRREDFTSDWDYRDAELQYKKQLIAYNNWEDPIPLMQEGAIRNAIRYAEADGLRVIAWLAKYIPAGEDPLKHVIQFAVESGFDVNHEDVEWAENND